MPTLREVLRPTRIMGRIDRLGEAPRPLSKLFNVSLTGGNVDPIGGRKFNYDIFNRTRLISGHAAPTAPRRRIAPIPVGQITGQFPRMAEEIPLEYERLVNDQRAIGGPLQQLDPRGETFIMEQETYMADRVKNMIEFQLAAMLRGTYVYTQDGDDLIQSFTGAAGAQVVDFQHNALNQGAIKDLDDTTDIIDVTWDDANAKIPNHLQKIDAVAQARSGLPVWIGITSGTVWQYMLENNHVKAQSGTANRTRKGEEMVDEETKNRVGYLDALPGWEFHIVDSTLEIGTSGTRTRLIAEDEMILIPRPARSWFTYGLGSEPVVENPPNGPMTPRTGYYAWSYTSDNPAGIHLAHVHNGIPFLKIPNAVFRATVL